jgi:hypothetical protein
VPASACDPVSSVVESERVLSARTSGAALELGLCLVKRTMGPKLLSMVAADLGLDLDESKARIELRY